MAITQTCHWRDDAAGAAELDASDPLLFCRDLFHLPRSADGSTYTYLCGNALGLAPRATALEIERELASWARLGYLAYSEAESPWVEIDRPLRKGMASVVGADITELVLMNSTTVNLHSMLTSFYRPRGRRRAIAIEAGAFPTQRFAAQAQIRLAGLDPARELVELTPRDGESTLRTEDVETMLAIDGDRLSVLLLGGVNYYSGQLFDLRRIAVAARAAGVCFGVDLAHAVGNVELALHDWGIDFGVWSTYKYLNGPPGGVAGCFVHGRRARDAGSLRLAGWWGQREDTRLSFPHDFEANPDAGGWQLSGPPVLGMAALRRPISLFEEIGMPAIRSKSVRLTAYLEYLLEHRLGNRVEQITPRQADARGAQLSLRIAADGAALLAALRKRGFLCDWKPPCVLRIAPAPLYNRFAEVRGFVLALESALDELGVGGDGASHAIY